MNYLKEMIAMSKEDIKKRIEAIQGNSQYYRVSDNHPLELYIGKNEKGCPTLRYNGTFHPAKLIGNSVLEIKQVKTSTCNSLLFTFTSSDNSSIFYNFCEDIINKTAEYNGEDGYAEIVNRYIQWKRMFYSSSKLLSENEIMGLIGELTFLKDFTFKIYGITEGLNGWSGPEPTHKDFSFGNDWYEIKTVNSFKNVVNISSVEQLYSEYDGHLVVYQLEKMSPSFEGVKLNKLVASINEQIVLDNDKDVFFEKLKQVGYSYNEIYDNYCYNFVGKKTYIVNDGFPRIKTTDIPQGIGKVQYEVILSMIEKFKED